MIFDMTKRSGGGVKTYHHGTAILKDVDTYTLSITLQGITLTGNEKILCSARAIRTGTVADNVITWDDVITIPADANANTKWWCPILSSAKDITWQTDTVYYSDGTPLGTKTINLNMCYRTYNKNNGNATGGAATSINTETNEVTISTGSSSYKLCYSGYAVEYEYYVAIFAENGTPISSLT